MATSNCGCVEPMRTPSERRRSTLRGLSTEVPQSRTNIERDGGDTWCESYSCCSTGNAVCTCGGGAAPTCNCSG